MLVICRAMIYVLIIESMEYASLAQHANLIIQFWQSLRTMAWPHLLSLFLIHLSLVVQEVCQLSSHLRHLHLNYQVTYFNTLIQKLQKIHPNKLILHQIPSQPPQSLYMTKLLEVWYFLGTLFHILRRHISYIPSVPPFHLQFCGVGSLFRGCCDSH